MLGAGASAAAGVATASQATWDWKARIYATEKRVLTGAIAALATAVFSDRPLALAGAALLGGAAMATLEVAMVRRAVASGRATARPRFPAPPANSGQAGEGTRDR